MKLLPKLAFDRIIDFTSINDIENLKKGLEKSPYENFCKERLEQKNFQPFVCHLCLTDETLEKLRRLFVDVSNDHPDCWSLLVEQVGWNHNGIQLKTREIGSLADGIEVDEFASGFIRQGSRKFAKFMLDLKTNESERSSLKEKMKEILSTVQLFHGFDPLIKHMENEHRQKRSLLEVYNSINDQFRFNLASCNLRVNLNPNTFIGIHSLQTFLSIGNAYLINDTMEVPINRHMQFDATLIPLIAVRDLFTKTIEAYEQMVLFKPPYETNNHWQDEFYKERMRIKHFKKNISFLQNIKTILDLIVPFRF